MVKFALKGVEENRHWRWLEHEQVQFLNWCQPQWRRKSRWCVWRLSMKALEEQRYGRSFVSNFTNCSVPFDTLHEAQCEGVEHNVTSGSDVSNGVHPHWGQRKIRTAIHIYRHQSRGKYGKASVLTSREVAAELNVSIGWWRTIL